VGLNSHILEKESKLTLGAKYLIKTNKKHLKSLELLKPLKLEHKDIDKSKAYKKLLQFYVTLGEEILILEENNKKLKNVLADFIHIVDNSSQLDYKEVEKLKSLL
tara:strand:+ start:9858 stop:10172 length:315 start_codon:yes stop_codon:yes gene_type:complete